MKKIITCPVQNKYFSKYNGVGSPHVLRLVEGQSRPVRFQRRRDHGIKENLLYQLSVTYSTRGDVYTFLNTLDTNFNGNRV